MGEQKRKIHLGLSKMCEFKLSADFLLVLAPTLSRKPLRLQQIIHLLLLESLIRLQFDLKSALQEQNLLSCAHLLLFFLSSHLFANLKSCTEFPSI